MKNIEQTVRNSVVISVYNSVGQPVQISGAHFIPNYIWYFIRNYVTDSVWDCIRNSIRDSVENSSNEKTK